MIQYLDQYSIRAHVWMLVSHVLPPTDKLTPLKTFGAINDFDPFRGETRAESAKVLLTTVPRLPRYT